MPALPGRDSTQAIRRSESGVRTMRFAVERHEKQEVLCPVLSGKLSADRKEAIREETVKWEKIEKAPMYVGGNDALVGQWVDGWGWKKVVMWEPEWTRDEVIARGATHWWPHLRDLPKPE